MRTASVSLAVLLGAVACASAKDPLVFSIEDYVKRAQEQGKDSRINELGFEVAGYSKVVTLRGLSYPTLNATHSASRSETDASGTTSSSESQTTTLSLNQPFLTGTKLAVDATRNTEGDPTIDARVTQPLYLFVKNSSLRSRRRALLSFESAQDSFEAQNLAIRASARANYFDVLLAEEQIKVDERKLQSSRKLVDITTALVQGGQKAAVETMRAKLKMQTDERSLQNTTYKRDQSVLKAKNYISLPPDQPIRFVSRLPFSPVNVTLPALVDYALVHEPTLRSLRRAQELAKMALQESKEATRPNLSVGGNYTYSETGGSQRRQWTLSGSVSWLLFDSFISANNVEIQRINLLVSDINLKEGELKLRQNVESTFLDLKRAEQQIRDFQTTREQARRNLEVIRLRFQNGLEKLIDVFDAENDARTLEREYLDLLVSFNKAKDSLSQQVGGDIEAIR